VRAMILAAGLGTRLRPITDTTPKPLVQVAGKPLIHYPLLLLKKHGIYEVLINTHHLADKVTQTLGSGQSLGMRITWSHEPEILGTGGGVKKAEEFFERQTFILINADTILDIDLKAVVSHHKKKKASATMVLKQVPDWREYGAVEVDYEARVRRIRGRPELKINTELKPMVFTGIHILEPEILDGIPAGQKASIILDGYIPLIERDCMVSGFITNKLWLTVDTKEKLEEAEKKLAHSA
jgi:mannose-1-phosphate guanylyltransferase